MVASKAFPHPSLFGFLQSVSENLLLSKYVNTSHLSLYFSKILAVYLQMLDLGGIPKVVTLSEVPDP